MRLRELAMGQRPNVAPPDVQVMPTDNSQPRRESIQY
jgi:hypothetical protein